MMNRLRRQYQSMDRGAWVGCIALAAVAIFVFLVMLCIVAGIRLLLGG
jgi:cell division protein FtsX